MTTLEAVLILLIILLIAVNMYLIHRPCRDTGNKASKGQLRAIRNELDRCDKCSIYVTNRHILDKIVSGKRKINSTTADEYIKSLRII